MDYLLAVDDFSRIGALRLRGKSGEFLRAVEKGERATPPIIELQRIYTASRAVESGDETAQDIAQALNISVRTVVNHTQSIKTKFEVERRSDLISIAQRVGEKEAWM